MPRDGAADAVAARPGAARGRILRVAVGTLAILALAAGAFLLFGGPEAVVRARLRRHLVGTVDAPDLEAGPTRVTVRNGRLLEAGHPDHVLLLAPEAEADVDLLRTRVPRIRIRGGVLDFRERIDTGFVRRTGGRFPRLELEDTTVRLRGETVLTARWATLQRDESREYLFRGRDLVHRGLPVESVRLRLSEQDGGADVPGAVVRLLGGTVTGTLSVRADGRFAGRFGAAGIALEGLSLVLGSPDRTRFGGRLDAEVEVRGDPHDLAALRASGRIRVDGLTVRDEPLILALLGLLQGVSPGETPFTEGSGRFEIEGALLRIPEAEVMGPRWGLRGEGIVDLANRTVELEVVLVSRRDGATGVAVENGRLRRITRAIRQRVARARIHGPFDELRVTSAALEDLRGRMAEFVGRLLGSDR